MRKDRILVIEDEEDIQALIHFNLVKAGFEVECAATGEDGFAMVGDFRPDLIVLDLMLPGIDGLEVCRLIRNSPDFADLHIIMLTAKGSEEDIITGLEAGADDYITKPFRPKILQARIRTALRRRPEDSSTSEQIQPIEIYDLYIHPGRNRVKAAGTEVELTASEFQLLILLASQPGWVFSRSQIIDAIHGEDYTATSRAIDVLIVGLRKKLGPCGEYIETIRGTGYRFKE